MENKVIAGLVSCLIGAVGGAAFLWLGMPLPWVLGAMLATAAGAISGARLSLPVRWRNAALVVLGITIGSTYGPESFSHAGEWIASLGATVVYSMLVGGLCTFYLMRFAGHDLATAYFSGMPGGMNEMVIVGQHHGGDPRKIALSHGVRVLIVVTLVVTGFRFLFGYSRPDPVAAAPIDPVALAWLGATALVGIVVSLRLRLPAPFFLGPLLASLLTHATGVSHAAPPAPLIAVAQVVLGTSLGVRFTGITRAEITGTAFHAGIASCLQLVVTGLAAVGLGRLLGLDAGMLFLAFAPAGIAEMTLVALALGFDPAFVAVHQLLRLVFVFAAAPASFRLALTMLGKDKDP